MTSKVKKHDRAIEIKRKQAIEKDFKKEDKKQDEKLLNSIIKKKK
jgi:hypothetical protein